MKQKIPYILLLFSTMFTFGQVTLAVSDVKEAKLNQRFNLTVLLEISGENMEQETPLRMPDLSKFEIVGTASDQNTIVLDPKRGDVVNQMVYQLVLTPKQVGKIKFGSVLVTVNGKIYKTEPFDINVKDIDKKSSLASHSSADDVYLNLEVQEKEVFKNEPTVAVLRAYSKNYGSFRNLGSVQLPKQRNVNFRPISLAKSEIESASGMKSQVVGVFLVFPSETGKIDINPLTASIANSGTEDKIHSNRITLSVKKLPEGMPEHFKNAVGKFNISVAIKDKDQFTELQKPVNITMNISGVGNLGMMNLPKIVESNDYTFFAPKISAKTSPEKTSLSGSVSAEYVVIPKRTGMISVHFEDFSFFDPELKQYVDLGAKTVELNVKTPEQIADAKSTLEKVNDYTNNVLETVNTPVLQTHNLLIKNRDINKINWKIIAGNLVLLSALLSLIFAVRSRRQKPVLVSNSAISRTIAETEEVLREDLSPGFSVTEEYLKKLVENKDFAKFFSAYDEMVSETWKKNSASTESEFRHYLEENKGQNFADRYRALTEQLHFEKYAPVHNQERIEELLISISSIFSEINK